jgi:Tol biopolymer transport system component
LNGARVDWEIVGWFPDSTKFVLNSHPLGDESHRSWNAKGASIWKVSLLGGAPHKLRDEARGFSVSPDGSWIAFGTNAAQFGDREIWLMGPEGESGHKIYETDGTTLVAAVDWAPDGQRVAYLKLDQAGVSIAIESRDFDGGSPTEIFRSSGEKPLRGFIWSPDGRLIYALEEPGDNMCSYWQMHIDPRSGKPEGRAKRVANWLPNCVEPAGFTADGKHLAFVRWAGYSGVYIAGLDADNSRITKPKRLTLDDTWNNLLGWTPDSKSVLLLSSRNKQWEIFLQGIDADTPERIVAGRGGSVSPDGSWVLYQVRMNERDGDAGHRQMKIPITGGSPAELTTGHVNGAAQCARLPVNLCVIADQSSDRKQLIFSVLDLQKGRGRELLRFDVDPDGQYSWALSPEGSQLAVLKSRDATIHVLSLTGNPRRDIAPEGRKIMTSIAWTTDGKGFFVSSLEKGGWTLLHVNLHGAVHALWQRDGSRGVSGMPSPNGRHLAIRVWLYSGNIWMADNL